MSEEEIPLTKKDQLALVIAHGKSVAAWARQNGVPKSTAYWWAQDADLRRNVDDRRRRSLDRSLDLPMARRSTQAVNTITKLANLPSPSRFNSGAARAVLAAQIAVSKYATIEYRIRQLEKKQRAGAGNTKSQH